MTLRVRISKRQRLLLKRLKQDRSVKEKAVDEGIIEERTERLTYEDLMRLMIPEDAGEMNREMTLIDAPNVKERVQSIAGDNVAEHMVVDHFAEQLADQHDVEIPDYE